MSISTILDKRQAMTLSLDAQSLRLEYIPCFPQGPNRYFIGFLRDGQTSNQTWDQIRERLRRLVFSFCLEQARDLTVTKCFYSLEPVHSPLRFCDQATLRGHTSTCVGITVLQIQDHHTEISHGIQEINRYIINALFALPFRVRRESDSSLLARLRKDRIYPDVPTLEEMCMNIAAFRLAATQIAHLPVLLQNGVARVQKGGQQCHGKALSRTAMVMRVFGQVEGRS